MKCTRSISSGLPCQQVIPDDKIDVFICYDPDFSPQRLRSLFTHFAHLANGLVTLPTYERAASKRERDDTTGLTQRFRFLHSARMSE